MDSQNTLLWTTFDIRKNYQIWETIRYRQSHEHILKNFKKSWRLKNFKTSEPFQQERRLNNFAVNLLIPDAKLRSHFALAVVVTIWAFPHLAKEFLKLFRSSIREVSHKCIFVASLTNIYSSLWMHNGMQLIVASNWDGCFRKINRYIDWSMHWWIDQLINRWIDQGCWITT